MDPAPLVDSGATADPAASDPGPLWPRLAPLAEVYAALVTGVRDYVRKNGFRSVILGLSGGIDSALTATIAADAIGPDQRARGARCRAGTPPSTRSPTPRTCVKRQGLHVRTVPIQPMVDAFQADLTGDGTGRGEPSGAGTRRHPDVRCPTATATWC